MNYRHRLSPSWFAAGLWAVVGQPTAVALRTAVALPTAVAALGVAQAQSPSTQGSSKQSPSTQSPSKPGLPPQDAADIGITEARVRETVTWLAADDRAGRDTGSPEAAAAADWIAARFAAAGLSKPPGGAGDGFRHEFPMPGWALDSGQIELKLTRRLGGDNKVFRLVADADVRQWRVADGQSGNGSCLVASWDDPVLQRLLRNNAARQPVVVEVDESSPQWQRSKGRHTVLGGKRQASRPVFLVKKGVLPASAGTDPDWSAEWKVAVADAVELPQANVMALWPGSTKKDEVVVVSAHYDHIGIGSAVEGDTIYNGADDNATGTTAVLLLAEALAKGPPLARSVLFVCFTAEERGLKGSAAFCERPPLPLASIVCNLNLEMLGRPPDGKAGAAWITGSEYSDFQALAGGPLATAGVRLVEFAMAKQLFRASDNWSFVKHGVVAHSLSAGSLHPDYHQPDDEVDRLDIPHMTTVIGGLLALVRDLGNRDQPPQWNAEGRTVSGRRDR